MTQRAFLLCCLAALGAALLSRGAGNHADPGRPLSTPASEASLPARPAASADPAAEGRDPFRYPEEPQSARPAAIPRLVQEIAPPSPSPPPSAVRLVGMVRTGGGWKAALAFGGDVSLVAVGQEVGGYVVVAVDEESGVRLRDPAGLEIVLPPS